MSSQIFRDPFTAHDTDDLERLTKLRTEFGALISKIQDCALYVSRSRRFDMEVLSDSVVSVRDLELLPMIQSLERDKLYAEGRDSELIAYERDMKRAKEARINPPLSPQEREEFLDRVIPERREAAE